MLKQNIVTDTAANEMIVELSDAEQEASNGGIAIMPSPETPLSMPEYLPISHVGMYAGSI
jgi:hypothetical protein